MARLGHATLTETMDTCGHLFHQGRAEATAAHDRAFGATLAAAGGVEERRGTGRAFDCRTACPSCRDRARFRVHSLPPPAGEPALAAWVENSVRRAASVAVVGFLVLTLGLFRAAGALPFISDCCGCGSVLSPDFDQAQPPNGRTDEFGYWFVVEECQEALAARSLEVLMEVAGGAALLSGGLVVSAGARRRHLSAA